MAIYDFSKERNEIFDILSDSHMLLFRSLLDTSQRRNFQALGQIRSMDTTRSKDIRTQRDQRKKI